MRRGGAPVFFCQTGFFFQPNRLLFSAKQVLCLFCPSSFSRRTSFFAFCPPFASIRPDKVFLSVKQVWRLFGPRFFSAEKFLCGAVLFSVCFSVGQLSSVLHFFVKSLTKNEKSGFENKVGKNIKIFFQTLLTNRTSCVIIKTTNLFLN